MTDPERNVPIESPSQARMHRRLGLRLILGGVAGATLGLALGALAGAVLFDRQGAVLTALLAGGVFGFAVGMLMLGYSSLESPDPGAEPSDTQRPVADRAELTRREHPITGNESPQTKENAPGSVSHRGRSA